MKRALCLLFAVALLLMAASPSIKQRPASPGAGMVEIAPQAAPTTLTVVTGDDAWIYGVTVINTNASAQTFLLQTAGGVALVPTISVAANSVYYLPFPYGQYSPGGFSVVAGGTGVNYYATWRQ